VAAPLAFVVAKARLRVPQDAPLVVKLSGSPATKTPPLVWTMAVTVEVVVPSAGTVPGFAIAATVFTVAGGGLLVWVILVLPLLPVPDSVTVTMQKPMVVDTV
jgi:hypothetical protein